MLWLTALLLCLPLTASAQQWIYTVVEGDNLWDLSAQHLDRVTRFEALRRLNNIEHPRRMQPGTRLRVPLAWIRSNPVPARLLAVQGKALLQRADGDGESAVQAGTLLYLGDSLRTGADSSVAIQFADQTVLTLHDTSRIRFDHLSAHGTTGMVDSRLNLLEGRMDTRVTPSAGPGSRFEISTPSAVSAVRGTEYRATVSEDAQASNIEVLHGAVAVRGGDRQQLVKAGYGTQVAVGQAPMVPRRLLPAPQLAEIPARIRQLNWPLSWPPLPGASRYRVEISADTAFDTLLWQQLVERPRVALPDLPDAVYQVRVRGIDDLGLEGHNRHGQLLIDVRPQPPVPLKPADGLVVRGSAPELQWTGSAEASRYRLQIAVDEQFSQPLYDSQELTGTRFDNPRMGEPGQYRWRLASIAADGEQGPWSVTRGYLVKPIPAAVEPQLAADDGRLIASWREAAPGQTYQVQMAYDPGFDDLELELSTVESQLAFEPILGQVRHLRVRAVEPDGYLGPWGATQRVDPLPDDSAWFVPIAALLGFLLL